MEVKYTLHKPYTVQERIDFILYYGQNCKGELDHTYQINETEDEIQALDYTEEEKKAQREAYIGNLSLTGTDVERAMYMRYNMNFDDLIQFVKKYCEENNFTGIDIKRLGIELKANTFVRRHDYINIVGQMLGCISEDMDYLFLNKEFPPKQEEKTEETEIPAEPTEDKKEETEEPTTGETEDKGTEETPSTEPTEQPEETEIPTTGEDKKEEATEEVETPTEPIEPTEETPEQPEETTETTEEDKEENSDKE